jgi:hypothetical protein
MGRQIARRFRFRDEVGAVGAMNDRETIKVIIEL